MENVEFLLLWKENEKSGNGLFFLSWKVMTFHFFSFMSMEVSKNKPRTGTKLSTFGGFAGFSQKH